MRRVDPTRDVGELGDLEPRQLTDGVPGDGGRAGGLVESLAVTLGAAHGVREPRDRVLLALRQVVGRVEVDPLEPLHDALVVLREPASERGGGGAAVEQGVAFGVGPLTQRRVGVERADVGVLLVPVAAVAEPG